MKLVSGTFSPLAFVALMLLVMTTYRACAEPAPSVVLAEVKTPLWTIKIQSDVADLFSSFAQQAAANPNKISMIEDVIGQSGLPDHSEQTWPIERLAATTGLFSISTTVAFATEFLLNMLESGDFKSVLFQDIRPTAEIKEVLNLRIFKSSAAFKAATGAAGPESANGLYAPNTNTIFTYFPEEFLDGFYRPSEGLETPTNQAAAAIIGVRRTVAKTYFHELIHALQHASGHYYLASPFIAEGQAQFLTEKIARMQVLSPMIAAEALAGHSDMGAALADPAVRAEVAQLRRNVVLAPEEYSKLRRAGRIKLGDGTTLSSMLTMSGDDFYADPEVQRSYDLAWALFLFLDSEESATKDFTLVRESAEKLDAAKHLSEFADLETRLSAFLLSASGPDQDVEDVLVNQLAPQVTKSDAHAVKDERFSAYKEYISILKAAPDAPDVLAYIADLFPSADDRDVFSTLYNRALSAQSGGAQTLGAPLRIVGRYVDTLMRLGLLNQAASTIASMGNLDAAQMTALDEPTRESLDLLASYLKKRGQLGEQSTPQLDCELSFGQGVLAFNLVAHTPELEEALKIKADPRVEELRDVVRAATAKSRESLISKAKKCEISKVDDTAWFVSSYMRDRGTVIAEVNSMISSPPRAP
jgi:hypothetical protein